MRRVLMAVAVLGLAMPALAIEVVTLEDWDGSGPGLDANWTAGGATAVATFAKSSDQQTITINVGYGDADADKSVQLRNEHEVDDPYGLSMVDMQQWVLDAGGVQPTDGPGKIICDFKIDMVVTGNDPGNPYDVRRLGFDSLSHGGFAGSDLGGGGVSVDSPSYFIIDLAGPADGFQQGNAANINLGEWNTDMTLVSWENQQEFPAEIFFHQNFWWTIDERAGLGTQVSITLTLDNLRMQYTPEPASALMLAIGGLFLRRRRR